MTVSCSAVNYFMLLGTSVYLNVMSLIVILLLLLIINVRRCPLHS